MSRMSVSWPDPLSTRYLYIRGSAVQQGVAKCIAVCGLILIRVFFSVFRERNALSQGMRRFGLHHEMVQQFLLKMAEFGKFSKPG